MIVLKPSPAKLNQDIGSIITQEAKAKAPEYQIELQSPEPIVIERKPEMTINVRLNSGTKQLHIYAHDDPVILSDRFSDENGIYDEEKRQRLENMVVKKVYEHRNANAFLSDSNHTFKNAFEQVQTSGGGYAV